MSGLVMTGPFRDAEDFDEMLAPTLVAGHIDMQHDWQVVRKDVRLTDRDHDAGQDATACLSVDVRFDALPQEPPLRWATLSITFAHRQEAGIVA